MLTHAYDYGSILETSQRINWKIEDVIGDRRELGTAERAEVEVAQLKSYRSTFLLSGMTHLNFDRSLRELSTEGHRRVGELARAIS